MSPEPTDEMVEAMAHSLWSYGALSFKDDNECGYGLDDIAPEQRDSFLELARNVLTDIGLRAFLAVQQKGEG